MPAAANASAQASAQDFKNARASIRNVVGSAVVAGLGGKTVHIGKMSAADRDRCQASLLGMESGVQGTYRARLVAAVACDGKGERLFTREDEGWLASLDHDVLEPIVDAALAQFKDKTGEMEKNSGAVPTAFSATA